jgi:hypothetical protein
MQLYSAALAWDPCSACCGFGGHLPLYIHLSGGMWVEGSVEFKQLHSWP